MPRRLIPRRLAPDEQATLVEHLGELRHRILVCVIAIVPAFIFSYAVHDRLIRTLKNLLPDGTEFVTLGVTEPFTTSVKVSMYAALGLCLPILVWQIWAFFAPALDRKTQRALTAFVVLATGLFAGGVAFGYFVILPRALEFLVGYDGDLYTEQVRASYFLSFVTLMLFATGVAFMMPIFILGLVRIGVLSSATLRRNRRIGIVAMLCFAILLPTVDPVSLVLETVPLIVLFELSIWLAAIMEKRWDAPYAPYDDLDDWDDERAGTDPVAPYDDPEGAADEPGDEDWGDELDDLDEPAGWDDDEDDVFPDDDEDDDSDDEVGDDDEIEVDAGGEPVESDEGQPSR